MGSKLDKKTHRMARHVLNTARAKDSAHRGAFSSTLIPLAASRLSLHSLKYARTLAYVAVLNAEAHYTTADICTDRNPHSNSHVLQ